MVYNFKSIQTVPTAGEFVDIVLSKIQRKTPTVIHPNFKISRIRQFYMRKVKFAEECFVEKLDQILNDFPKLDEIHPFYADLMNVLYDRDHYKLALAQIHTAKRIIDSIAKDYVKLLKFGDSLFRCKQLKRAALGRMATAMKRQKDPLQYLEHVRQHLGRLPSIDPNTRTLLICGYPNVGKSSFINKLTRADVDVQPYAFTTKSLFVGHMDYKHLRWQVIDTPGILDHPLEQRNTIEMQSITALAHLRSAILYFMDLSEQCGYSIKDQIKLYHSIKPLFANKPTFVVFNKVDIIRPDQISEEDKNLLKEIGDQDGVQFMQSSCHTEEGVMEVRDKTCDALLAMRVETRMKTGKVGESVLNRLHLAQPVPRDQVERPAFIPDAVLNRIDNPTRKLERDLEMENGGAGVYNIDLKKQYMLKNEEWKHDIIPEIMDGKNVADFFDADIEKKLAELDAEEARLEAAGFYDVEDIESSEDEEDRPVRDKAGNRPTIPRKFLARQVTTSDMLKNLKEAGVPVNEEAIRGRSLGRNKRARSETRDTIAMEVDDDDVDMVAVDKHKKLRAQSQPRARSSVRDRSTMGVKDEKQKVVADKIKKQTQRTNNLLAKAGEADRRIPTKMPKHLFAGKRKGGKTDRR